MIMDVLEAIRKRRRVVEFTDRPIDRSTMTQILEAARWSPSGGNQQRWRFIVVTDPNTKEMICNVSPGIYGCPTAIIAVCAKKSPRDNEWDRWMEACEVGLTAQNIALAAFSLELGSCMVAGFAKESVQQILDLAEDIDPQLLVTLGYYEQLPQPPGRLRLGEVAFSERYGREWQS
jgi:nitroreductase